MLPVLWRFASTGAKPPSLVRSYSGQFYAQRLAYRKSQSRQYSALTPPVKRNNKKSPYSVLLSQPKPWNFLLPTAHSLRHPCQRNACHTGGRPQRAKHLLAPPQSTGVWGCWQCWGGAVVLVSQATDTRSTSRLGINPAILLTTVAALVSAAPCP